MIPTNRPHPIAPEVGDKAKFSVEVAVTSPGAKSSSGASSAPATESPVVGTPANQEISGSHGTSKAPVTSADVTSADVERLIPIGEARLRALREAIRKGTYPTESDVVGGLMRIFRSEDDI